MSGAFTPEDLDRWALDDELDGKARARAGVDDDFDDDCDI